ncbi:MAG: PEP-CTERM sorting domain-containing protein [Sedimentisphaerales bacterium]|nr:PEP-CTERM sorting domain-containing protein [Sedimentisphaerales bacterium]
MKKMLFTALAAVFGMASLASAAIVDFSYVTKSNNPGDYSNIFTVAAQGNDAIVEGLVFGPSAYVVAGEQISSSAASDNHVIYVTNQDNNDNFKFTLVALDSSYNFIATGTSVELADGETGMIQLTVTNVPSYFVGVKVEGDNDVFKAKLSYVPEPLTLSSLAIGGLALLRKNRR